MYCSDCKELITGKVYTINGKSYCFSCKQALDNGVDEFGDEIVELDDYNESEE
jgi:hypothetical protein